MRAAAFGLEILRFCRSWADGSSGGFCFLNWWPDLHSFEGLSRWSSRICGGAWRCVVAPLLMIFSGFCASKSLEDFCGLIFYEILSETLEIWDGRLQTLLDLLPPWSTLAVAILTMFDIGKAASVSAFKVGSTSSFEQCLG